MKTPVTKNTPKTTHQRYVAARNREATIGRLLTLMISVDPAREYRREALTGDGVLTVGVRPSLASRIRGGGMTTPPTATYTMGVGNGEVWVDTVPPDPTTMPTTRVTFPVSKRDHRGRKENVQNLMRYLGILRGYTKPVPAARKIFTVKPPRQDLFAPVPPVPTPAAPPKAPKAKRPTVKRTPKPKAVPVPVPVPVVPTPTGVVLSGDIAPDDRALLNALATRLGYTVTYRP